MTAAAQQSPRASGAFWSLPRPHPTLAHQVLDRTLPAGWYRWELESLILEVERRFGVRVGPTSLLLNLLGAIQLARSNDLPWHEWNVFEKVGVTLQGTFPMYDQIQPMDPGEVGVALHLLGSIRTHPYGDEVKKYVAAMCFQNGLYYLPKPYLEIGQAHLSTRLLRGGLPEVRLPLLKRLYEEVGPGPGGLGTPPEDLTEAEAIQLMRAMAVRYAVQASDLELERQRGLV